MELLRAPGESLRKQIDELNDTISEKLMFLFVGPISIYSAVLSQAFFSGKPPALWVLLFLSVVTVSFCIWQGRQLYLLLINRNKYRLGYECEATDLRRDSLNRLIRVFQHVSL